MNATCCFIKTPTPNSKPAGNTISQLAFCRAFHITHKPAVTKNAAKCVACPASPSMAGLAAITA